MINYAICPICGNLTDDGTIIKTRHGLYLVCFDCSEDVPGWLLHATIERMELDGSIRYVGRSRDDQ